VAWREEAARRAPRRFRGEVYWSRPLPAFGNPRARLRIVGLGTSSLKVMAASLLMGIAMFAFIRATNITVDLQQTKIGLLLQTAVAVAVGMVAYLSAATLFRVSELAEITAAVRSRAGRRAVVASQEPPAPG